MKKKYYISKKYKIIISLSILFFLIFVGIYYEKEIHNYSNKNENIDIFVRNITWDTKAGTNIPYQKGDIIKYDIILKPGKDKKLLINNNKLSKKLDIQNITLNGNKIDDINNINIKKDSILSIEGKIKTDNNILEVENDIIEFEIINIEKEKIIKNEEKNIEKEIVEESNDKVEENILEKLKPSNIFIKKLNYSSNIDNLIKISGIDIDLIKYVNIGNSSFIPQYSDKYIYILVEDKVILSGDYFIFFTLDDSRVLPYKEKISFLYESSSINISNITPRILKNDISRNIILQGGGFSEIISIQLSNNVVLENTSFNIINDNVMSILIPKELQIGTYSLNIMGIKGIYKSNIDINITN